MSKKTNISETPSHTAQVSSSPLISFEDAWAQKDDGERVFKIEHGSPFYIYGSLLVKIPDTKYSLVTWPVKVGLEFVHIYAVINGNIKNDFQELNCQNTGKFIVKKKYDFSTQGGTTVVLPGSPIPDDFGSLETIPDLGFESGPSGKLSLASGDSTPNPSDICQTGDLHMFQIIADVSSQNQSRYMAISPWIYVRII